MVKTRTRISTLMLSVLLLFTSIFSFSTTEQVKAADVVEWTLYELSYWNNDKSVEYKEGHSYTKIGNNISSSNTFITSDGKYKMNITNSGNNATITGFTYDGAREDTLNIELPDVIKVVYFAEAPKKPTEEDLGNGIVNYATLNITSIATAFGTTGTNFNASYINLTTPIGVTTIDTGAFNGNTKLKSIEFRNMISTVGSRAFKGCINLQSINFDKIQTAMNTIPDECFYQCSSLENIVIPTTVLNIGKSAFYQCNKLDYLIFGNQVQNIGSGAFSNCANLRYIYITSNYQSSWNSIVDSSEVSKLITSVVDTAPILAKQGATSSLGVNLVSSGRLNIFSKIDISSASVKFGNEVIATTAYTDKTYRYDTKAFYFNTSEKGTYTVEAEDILGNKLSTSFRYIADVNDTTAPSFRVEGTGSNNIYNSCTVIINEPDTYLGSILLNNVVETLNIDQKIYTKTLSEEGVYKFNYSDVLNNAAESTITIDKTAPTITGVENNSIYNKKVTIKYSDSIGIASAKLNGVDIDSGASVIETGVYELVVSDFAGNTNKINFTIDINSPVITGVESGCFYNTDRVINFSATSGVTSATDTFNGRVTSLTQGSVISEEGTHKVTVTGASGKSTEVTFTIDKTAPVIEGVKNGSFITNLKSKATISDANYDRATLNGVTIKNTVRLDKDGVYTITAYDKAGNSSSIVVTVDTILPKLKGISDGKGSRKPLILKPQDKNGIKKMTVNGKVKKLGYKISKEGKYKVVIWDKAGNKATYTVYIDKKTPTIKGVKNNKTYGKNGVNLFISDKLSGIKSVKVDGATIKYNKDKGYAVRKSGKHTVIVTDKAGNKTVVRFTIKSK